MENVPPPPYTVSDNMFASYQPADGQGFNDSRRNITKVDVTRGVMGPTYIGTSLPVAITCPFCYQSVVTKPIAKVGLMTWTACFVLILFGLFLGCCLVPFCLKDFKDIYHVCPNCKYTVDVFKKMWQNCFIYKFKSVESFQQKMYSWYLFSYPTVLPFILCVLMWLVHVS